MLRGDVSQVRVGEEGADDAGALSQPAHAAVHGRGEFVLIGHRLAGDSGLDVLVDPLVGSGAISDRHNHARDARLTVLEIVLCHQRLIIITLSVSLSRDIGHISPFDVKQGETGRSRQ